ncbi:hypothetical protein [Halobaculum sp. D14]|uniref:hypothetical protein n=1 Tax=Halobaculum sp. D14 TaxID=3421642 RepID=UPI003EB6D548
MEETLFDAAWQVAEWLFVAAASVLFTGVGVHFEEAGRAALAAANLNYAAVDLALAALALLWGVYLCGYRQLLPRTRSLFANAD